MCSDSVGIACAYWKVGGGFRSHVAGQYVTPMNSLNNVATLRERQCLSLEDLCDGNRGMIAQESR